MYDNVIHGGTIVDGTGKAACSGDVAIADGRIAAVDGKLGPARRDIDADGLLITPGRGEHTSALPGRLVRSGRIGGTAREAAE
jgi:predicted amidohydrolase